MIRPIRLWLEKDPGPGIFWIGLLLACLVGWLDFVTGPELSFSIAYLLPISLVTWYAGLWPGIVISAASAILWLAADLLAGHVYFYWVIPYWNALVRAGIFVILAIIMARLKTALEGEKKSARTDPLTGAANLRYFLEVSEYELGRFRRYGRPFALAYLDADDFKTINDTAGHLIGDRVLRAIAQILQDGIRATDLLARLGGDEFVLLFPETEGGAASQSVERLRQKLVEEMRRRSWPITFSIGLLAVYRAPESVDTMIRLADDLMYTAKSQGKNQVQYAKFA